MTGTETPGSAAGISDIPAENQPEVSVSAQPSADVSPSPPSDPDLERLRINVEHYKAKLDFWKYVIVGGFVAAAIAAIPPFFQYSTAILEEAKSEAQLNADLRTKEADRAAKQEEFRQEYIKLFLDKAVDQDIELRLRFAEYFASVSADPFRAGWIDYRDRLETERQRIRDSINTLEREWVAKSSDPNKKQADIDEIERKLAWDYKEVGYVERNRSVSTNPRVPEQPFGSMLGVPLPTVPGAVGSLGVLGTPPLVPGALPGLGSGGVLGTSLPLVPGALSGLGSGGILRTPLPTVPGAVGSLGVLGTPRY